jgi:hypothetical protein
MYFIFSQIVSLKSILMIAYHLVFQVISFQNAATPKFYVLFVSHILTVCLAQPNSFTITVDDFHESQSYLLYSIINFPFTSPFWKPYIFHSILFPDICSYVLSNQGTHVSLYKATGRSSVLNIWGSIALTMRCPLSAKYGTNFIYKWRSLGRYSLLAEGHRVFLFEISAYQKFYFMSLN